MRALLALVALLAWLAAGCSENDSEPRAFTEQEKPIVASARKAVAQFEDWADQAEFKLVRRNHEWHVTAWRVVHPEAKGNRRYVPWGRREIIIDDAGKVIRYGNAK